MPERNIDPIPENFHTLEEAGEFWDTHDTMDYPEAFVAVGDVTTELRNRYFEVEVEMSVAQALSDKARQRGIPVRELATEILREQLAA